MTREAVATLDLTMELTKVTDESLKATTELRDFKTAGTKGLIECSIKAIAYPLLSDHVLREANYYLRILKMFQR